MTSRRSVNFVDPSSVNNNSKVSKALKSDAANRVDAKKNGSLKKLALTDCRAFADLIMFHGGWDNFGKCHEDLLAFITKPQLDNTLQQKLKFTGNEMEAHLRRMVLMPRGHLKSTIGTVLYTLWRIYRNPDIRILVACNLQQLAHSFIRELRTYLENQDLKSVWNDRPHIAGNLLPALDKRNRERNQSLDTETEDKKIIWNNVALQVNRNISAKEPTIYAASVGSTVTGMHFDLVILDDLVDFKNTESETKKTAVEEWIADVESVLNPPEVISIGGGLTDIMGGEIIINGTRYATDDYYGKILENQNDLGYETYIRNVYKNGKDASEGFLWHEKYTEGVLRALQARLSPRRFASQYLNTVYEKDTHLFDTTCITVVEDNQTYTHGGKCYFRHREGKIEQVNPIIAVDPAFSTSKTADDCAVLVGFKLNDGSLVVADCTLDRMEASTFVKIVQDYCRKYHTLRVFVEENGVGKLVSSLFAMKETYLDDRPIIVYGHWEQRVKESKIQGVLEIPIAAGKVWLSQKVKDNERIWKQIKQYPGVRHDDFLDGLVTLYEKTTNAREQYKVASQTGFYINGIPLVGDKRDEDWQKEHDRSYLSEFNYEFR